MRTNVGRRKTLKRLPPSGPVRVAFDLAVWLHANNLAEGTVVTDTADLRNYAEAASEWFGPREDLVTIHVLPGEDLLQVILVGDMRYLDDLQDMLDQHRWSWDLVSDAHMVIQPDETKL